MTARRTKGGGVLRQRCGIAPGEIWAVTGRIVARRSEWCAQIARADEEDAQGVALLNFAQHAEEAQRTGWTQARYYADEGKSVSDFLSFNAVYEVNPFEVGARYPETRKAYRRRLDAILRLLDLQRFKGRPLIALSNGEMRRALLARALAKRPKLLVLDDPAGGLDVRQREKLREVVASLAKQGLAVIFAYRHADELPPGVTKWLRIGKDGRAVAVPPPPSRAAKRPAPHAVRRPTDQTSAPPVVELTDLNLDIGGHPLFRHLSWTVRKGERWVLRGANGSGKTTLFALITGDSPLAYAADIKVFGVPRETGRALAPIRRRIGVVSPEMQACLGLSPETLLERALRTRHDLLLLDEPFMNMEAREARRLARRIESYLRAHRDVTAILVCHRTDEAPRGFDRELTLD